MRRGDLDLEAIQEIGRIDECWRYADPDGVLAREHAFNTSSEANAAVDFSADYIESNNDGGFHEVPRYILSYEDWEHVYSGRNPWDKSIHEKEGDALLWTVKHLLRAHRNWKCRHLILGDNLGLML
eukprot:11065387-Karenia_brevis.AAC.1